MLLKFFIAFAISQFTTGKSPSLSFEFSFFCLLGKVIVEIDFLGLGTPARLERHHRIVVKAQNLEPAQKLSSPSTFSKFCNLSVSLFPYL